MAPIRTPLHDEREMAMNMTAETDIRTDPTDDVFASTSMVTGAPSLQFPEAERDPRDQGLRKVEI